MIKKGQASLEYISIFGIIFVIIAVAGGIFFSYTNSAKESLDKKQINKIGQEIINNVQKIYFFGDGNRVTITPTFPQGIEEISIHHINQSGNNYYYINITVLNQDVYESLIFETTEDDIPFGCKNCTINDTIIGHNISSFNNMYFGQGSKRIKIESINDTTYVDFMN